MEALFGSLCQWGATADARALGAACAAMAAVLLSLIGLGFRRFARTPPTSAATDLGLRGTWRLYRRLRREARHA